MNERTGLFAGGNPFAIARAWLTEAEASEVNDPNAVALATVDGAGMPNVRVVLIKGISDEAFTFFTNYDSAKGQELAGGKAALVFHWKSLQRQVRVRGLIEKASAEASDAYYHSRALGSRMGAWASAQSQPLASRETLEAQVARAAAQHGDTPPRPPFWGGYDLRPLEMEFWAAGESRLHDRYRWTRETPFSHWKTQRLNP